MRPQAIFVCSLEWRYDGAMKDKTDSEEYKNFTSLLRRVVSVPHAEIQERIEDDKAEKKRTRESGKKIHRQRPIVSPASVASSKAAN
jgi:hypothetical protein